MLSSKDQKYSYKFTQWKNAAAVFSHTVLLQPNHRT